MQSITDVPTAGQLPDQCVHRMAHFYRNQSGPPLHHSLNFNPRNDWRDPTDKRVVANFNTLEAFTDLFLH